MRHALCNVLITMIIIDEDTEENMMRYLDEKRHQPGQTRCLNFHLKDLSPPERIQEMTDFSDATSDGSEMLFLMSDGDAFLFSSSFRLRDVRLTLGKLNSRLGRIVGELPGDYHDLAASWVNLFVIARDRYKAIRDRQHSAQLQQQQQQEENKRLEIINLPLDRQLVSSIAERRQRHEVPVILLVEDEIFSGKLVEGSLAASYAVTTVHNGESAILAYPRLAPDILFLDIDLPDISGHDVLQRLHEIDPAAYVVMLSGNADRHHIMKAMQCGASGFIAKPFTHAKLQQYIQNCPTVKTGRTGAVTT